MGLRADEDLIRALRLGSSVKLILHSSNQLAIGLNVVSHQVDQQSSSLSRCSSGSGVRGSDAIRYRR